MTGRTLLRGGLLIGLDRSVPDGQVGVDGRGDLLIEDDRIAAVRPALPAVDAEVIDATGMLVLPGLVDTHRHTWQSVVRQRGADWSFSDYFEEIFLRIGPRMRPEDVYAGTLLGALAALDSGVTTLVDWAHVQNTPEHADAGIEALRDAGIRAVFAHGWPCTDARRWMSNSAEPHPADLLRLRERIPGDDGLITLAMGARGPGSTIPEVTTADFELARELGLRITMHVLGDNDVVRLHGAGLLGPDITLVHASRCHDGELALAADHGVSVSIAPQIELAMPGLGLPTIERLLAAGLAPTLSVDSETAAAADMFTQMRMAVAAHRAWQGRELPARDVLSWATVHGAAASGLSDRIGSLAPGKAADVVLLRADDVNLAPLTAPAEAVVLAAHVGNVDTVLVAGRVVKRGGRLVGDLARARRLAAAASEHLR
ncbi:amidohydrolase family protein [Saccharopolyspora sp. K220]|uniref:amidohydrolase family protein n=1 Tax=Saccharopolyspora soli TaxID=2926618 RepID=UPI001F5AF93F|nr:amidohydrolase family protein [Saccharopolyspora soli]MCI2419086.1 amidohydrolase family protein [Saccharopolyspora soli]